MVVVAQLVRALDCGSRGRRFEPGLPPENLQDFPGGFFVYADWGRSGFTLFLVIPNNHGAY